jgi:Ni/Fe-hydrogenase subunit HybB-like protein
VNQLRATRQRVPLPGVILGGLVTVAALVALYRYLSGLGAISNLSDAFPWGLWISFDLLCGVALGAGAFTTAFMVYILGAERYRPLLRPAILTGFLGYLMVIVALLVDLGRPERIWHLLIYWNPHSVLFEVGWCVMLYTTVLALEFSPVLFERLGLKTPLRIIHAITIPLIIAGVLLSTLHQSSLGSMFLAMPNKVYALWYSPLLPVFFFLTAVAVGPSMVILEATISARALRRKLEFDLLIGMSRIIPIALGLYLVLRIADVVVAGEVGLLFDARVETLLFWTEMLVGIVAPLVLFLTPSGHRNPSRLFGAASLVIAGVVLNRFDVSLLAFAHSTGATYVPHWMEITITTGILSGGVIAYWLVARFFPLFGVSSGSHGTSTG